MFKKSFLGFPLPEHSILCKVSRVVRKSQDGLVDSSNVRDFSINFSVFPRDMPSDNFSLEAQQSSGLSLKEVNSVLFHDDELSPEELVKVKDVFSEKEDKE